MSATESPHISGYYIEKVYSSHQELRLERPDKKAVRDEYSVDWDWQIVSDRMFDVSLIVSLEPSDERWESVRVRLVGRFRVEEHPLSVPLEDFVKLQAPAILLPYAREVVTSLTARGFYGPYFLPAINVVRLMASKDTNDATGRRQLREGRSLALPPVRSAVESAKKALPRGRAKRSTKNVAEEPAK
jgi:preprotein translocase subunit SecB